MSPADLETPATPPTPPRTPPSTTPPGGLHGVRDPGAGASPANDSPTRPTADLDPVIHAASRLRVVTTLAALPPGDRIVFTKLLKTLDMTTGNLSTHLAKLEEAGYAAVIKTFEGRRPATYVELTDRGRAAFTSYLTQLRALLGGFE